MGLSEDTLPDAPWDGKTSTPDPVTASTPALDWSASSLVGLKRQSRSAQMLGREGGVESSRQRSGTPRETLCMRWSGLSRSMAAPSEGRVDVSVGAANCGVYWYAFW